MKIGLFLQEITLPKKKKDKIFYETLNLARDNNLDLLVFPEHFYCPEDEELENYAYLSYEIEENIEECDFDKIIDTFKKYSEIANCPILVSRADKYGFIYALYVSPYEENIKWYGKHIATDFSVFDITDYEEAVKEIFMPIDYKGYKIGVTICYDSTKPLFSRFYKAYGDIDILINLTGGHVDYKKWSIYQKARALENKCYNLCTMAYYDEGKRNKSYVFAYDGFGKK
ncbi:carbon-nitrogen hydrolase family protein [Caloramator sp. mosi_1]|uniref:carbon-nitrogen hydrolase family protein n=1 Tax=Caloramator sp. mosi_1 TaxID=3023090 RepID=UPI002360B4FC|nr:carbon-nitrogen hydrolase family protein [Caloramator sp. mosi_1]WDC83410.1 carbon-nitrogen hydrolase family protein [Caloramator sp. mosi_1]